MKLSRHEFLATFGTAAAGVPLAALAPPDEFQKPAPAARGRTGPVEAKDPQDYVHGRGGAHDPVEINDTYYFYRRGFRGVLVEPNVEMCKKLRAVRPQDTTLEAGIGVTAACEADYYLMTESAWNTFSKEEADHMARVTGGGIKIERVVKMPLLEINDVMSKHFHGAPTFH
jgi:hypothetical protein